MRERSTSAPKMTAFENGAEWHHPLSTPHYLYQTFSKLTYSNGSQHHHAYPLVTRRRRPRDTLARVRVGARVHDGRLGVVVGRQRLRFLGLRHADALMTRHFHLSYATRTGRARATSAGPTILWRRPSSTGWCRRRAAYLCGISRAGYRMVSSSAAGWAEGCTECRQEKELPRGDHFLHYRLAALI